MIYNRSTDAQFWRWSNGYQQSPRLPGPLVTLAQQAKEAGEPSWAAGSALVLAIFAIAGMLIIAWRFA